MHDPTEAAHEFGASASRRESPETVGETPKLRTPAATAAAECAANSAPPELESAAASGLVNGWILKLTWFFIPPANHQFSQLLRAPSEFCERYCEERRAFRGVSVAGPGAKRLL